MPNEKYTDEDRKRAISLYRDDKWGFKRVANEIGCSMGTVRRWIDSAGIDHHPGPAYTPHFKDTVISDYKISDHISLDQLAKDYEISPQTLHRWLRGAGVETRSQRPRVHNYESIIEDLKGGTLTKKEIAEKNGCSESWVYKVQRNLRK